MTEQSQESLKRIKTSAKSRLTKFKSFLEKYNSNKEFRESTDVEEINLRIKKVEESFVEYERAQAELETLLPNQNFEEEVTTVENQYYKLIGIAKKFVNHRLPQSSVSSANHQHVESQNARIAQLEAELRIQRETELASLREMASSRSSSEITHRAHISLPKLDLPSFSGKLDQWLGFRDAFTAIIHNDESMPKIQKLRYLRCYVKEDAARIIDNLETTDINYEVAWNLLNERYNNEKVIIQKHMQAVFELSPVSRESPLKLRNLLDDALRNIRALEVLGEPTDKWDTPLIFLIMSKLDRETRKEWEKSITATRRPNFEQLKTFLRERCQVLENIGYNNHEKSSEQNSKSLGKQASINKNTPRAFLNTQAVITCLICNDNHHISYCSEFKKLQVNERVELVKRKGLCFNCLKRNHLVSECKSGHCTICRRKHHTSLHLDSGNRAVENNSAEIEQGVKNLHIYDASKVLLSTAIVDVFDEQGERHACRVLLDNGSQPNIISRDLVARLKLKTKKVNISVEVVNDMETPCKEYAKIRLKSRNSNFETKLNFLVLPQITGNVPAAPINKTSLAIPKHVRLADPEFQIPNKIDALIGAEIFYDLLLQGDKRDLSHSGLALRNTKLGWVVTGKLGGTWGQTKVRCNLIRNNLSDDLDKFWKLEKVSGKTHLSQEEMDCERHFSENFQRTNEGRYMVRLPFNEKKQNLGLSYDIARKRFYALERRLERNLEMKREYREFMNTYEELGHMEPSQSGPDGGHYFSHHAVIKESSLTTKLRAVFNGAQKTTTGVTLNDTLMVGPNLQDGIFQLILRFRCHLIVMSADIEKMYRQFLVHPQDRIFQKILWRNNQSEPLKTYQLNTITYGTSSASFLATRCLRQLALDEGSAYPLAAEALLNDFYVDDLLSGADSLEEARRLRDEMIGLTSKAGLNLCKWTSNHPKVTDDLIDTSRNMKLQINPERAIRTLGVCWNATEDTLTYEVLDDMKPEKLSKRIILSKVAQLYDPLGLLAPVVILAKMMIQELWKGKLDWDDPVPEDIEEAWIRLQSQLPNLNNWSIERCVKMAGTMNIQLHGFSDASMKAYGACIYLRILVGSSYKTILVSAKSRVAPLNTESLPRLELCGAVLLVKLYKAVRESLKIKIDKTRFWCDSMITLGWIRSPPHRREVFVANRVAEIQKATEIRDWSHVPTKDNPADFVSRGQFPNQFLENDMWKRGPDWLSQPEENWPMEPKEKEGCQEETAMTLTVSIKQGNKELSNLWTRFSSFVGLIRFTAHALRLANKARKIPTPSGPIAVKEFQSAWRRIIELVQRENFHDEICSLAKDKTISKKSKLNRLWPYLEDGILRVGGRTKNAKIQHDKKHQILLPKIHPLTDLVIRENHAKLLHAGVNATLYAVRERYWIVDGRAAIRRILHACVRCVRANPTTVSYVMGDLPKVRLTAARPFTNTGVDFCGPFFIKEREERNRKKIKVYVAVFVCLSTKAIHVELVSKLTTDAFLGCLRRFFARRGKSSTIYSDNGSNFIGANNELKELYGLLKSEKFNEQTTRYLTNEGIQWHFSPPRTPHFGGIWEAAVKSLKHHMRRTLRDTLFSYEQLYTYLCEMEAILNSRPLTPMSSDPNDLEVLTPGHFLIGGSFSSLPSPDFSTVKINRLSSWQHLEKLRQDLWKRWYVEYLSEMDVRTKWQTGQPNQIKKGMLVVLIDENLPPLKWSMGRIIETHAGDDNIIRVVTVKTQNGICKRGVKKVSPLPVETDEN